MWCTLCSTSAGARGTGLPECPHQPDWQRCMPRAADQAHVGGFWQLGAACHAIRQCVQCLPDKKLCPFWESMQLLSPSSLAREQPISMTMIALAAGIYGDAGPACLLYAEMPDAGSLQRDRGTPEHY